MNGKTWDELEKIKCCTRCIKKDVCKIWIDYSAIYPGHIDFSIDYMRIQFNCDLARLLAKHCKHHRCQ